MAPALSCKLQEYELWPSRGRLLLLLVLLYNLPNTFSQFEGYSNVHFETNPEDVYTTLSLNIARFRCKAKGTLISSGQEELLDVRFLRDNISLSNSFYPAHRHQYEVQGDNYYVVGVIIEPVSLSDNGRSYQCQARINGTAVDLFSDTAHLIVGDGQPPSIPLTESSVGLYQITVTWSSIMLPSNGPILQYKAKLYTTSNVLIYNRTIDTGNVFQYTYTDLDPNTSYKLSVTGINSYGEGDEVEENALLQATTQTPVVTGPPSNLTFVTGPGIGNIIVSVESPSSFNNETMTPIDQYEIQYYKTGDSSSKQPKTMPANLPYFYLYDLEVGSSYTFEVTALNSAGPSQPIVVQYIVVAYTGTINVATFTSSFTTTTSNIIMQTTTTTTNTPVTTTNSEALVTVTPTLTGTQSQALLTTSTTPLALLTTSTTPLALLTTSTITSTATSQLTTDSITSISTNIALSSTTTTTTTTTTTLSTEASISSTATENTLTVSSSSISAIATTSIQPTTDTRSVTRSTTSSSSSSITRLTSSRATRPSNTDTTVTNQSNTGNSDELPINLVVIAIGSVAFVILIAIIIVAVLLLVFCVRFRKDNTEFTDFEPPSSWPHKPPSGMRKTWGSKDSSIKGSLSGSINHSISDDIELPIEGMYVPVSSESPPSIRSDRDSRTEIETKVEFNGIAKVSPV